MSLKLQQGSGLRAQEKSKKSYRWGQFNVRSSGRIDVSASSGQLMSASHIVVVPTSLKDLADTRRRHSLMNHTALLT